ncbi:MAG: hypothetical protein A2845_01970 [Candidatus Lloydbacteria bacterium RIFCSPHIGHO2_01_FULL_49_22]|uniref:Uncharacterized protein n=1 Tax=Candidatus Lloydbacteria bacterium RIFCSPHIGHO2_01_FULL_49_22 TaxID=1798658 RepID=A0A1G2CUH9_9BACT|nr:MAG: hypothetical protein A2845_01970 [Candidatus Lloydbacteria bacterium RIFCSPHIGHO2_01_FULL_49_22]OGZ09609.1 MAG: hypothetical protein A3C14_05945 [Candidatus Lloydbacteria bacterium RIFCSPHIGHO2_02_FULL_50_18]
MDENGIQCNLRLAKQLCVLWIAALTVLLAVGFVMIEYFFEGMPSGGQAVCLMAFGVVFFIMFQKLHRARLYLKQCLDEL